MWTSASAAAPGLLMATGQGFDIGRLADAHARFEEARESYVMSTSTTTRTSLSEKTNGGL